MFKFSKTKKINKHLKKPLREGFVFIESMLGSKLNGELYFAVMRILKTTNKTIVISAYDKVAVKKMIEFDFYKTRIIFTNRKKRSYPMYLATSQYLISDVSFPRYFSKRCNQIYYNTWHGTPIKTLGVDIRNSRIFDITNVHKNFNDANKIVVNSEYLKTILRDKYLLPPENGKFLLSSYMKNNTLKDGDFLKTSSKSVLFMYTWRKGKRSDSQMLEKLVYIDKLLRNNPNIKKGDKFQYVSHHLSKNFAKSFFTKIKLKNKLKILSPVDSHISANEAINMFDTLVTDFSSVMFDGAYLEKNVVLDWSSVDFYQNERGLYQDVMDDLPFKKHYTISDAIDSLWKNNTTKSKTGLNLHDFNNKYSTYDYNYDSNNTWLDDMFSYELRSSASNENKSEYKDWTLFYPGTLNVNGMTTSAIATIERLLELGEKIILWIPNEYIKNISILAKYGIEESDNIKFIASTGSVKTSFFVKVAFKQLLENRKVPTFLSSKIDGFFLNEKNKLFGHKNFKRVIHFSGYEYYVAGVLGAMKSSEKIIYVHNDMYEEYKNRKNYKKHSIYKAYDTYDKIVFVSEYLMNKSISSYDFFKKNKDKVTFVNNPISERIYEELSKPTTMPSQISKTKSNEVMASKIKDTKAFKIISIGRYSNEKNQKLLLDQFTKLKDKNPDKKIVLILVGSAKHLNKDYFAKLAKIISKSKYKDDIYQFSNINVFSLLKYSHVLALPSTHEGFPMVNLEANLEGLHVISSNLPGNIEQYEKYSIGENFDLDIKDDLFTKLNKSFELFESGKFLRNQKMSLRDYNEKIDKQIKENLLGK